jgi:hypothetical protein
MVVLHEIDTDPGIRQDTAGPGFGEKPTIVAKSSGLDQEQAWQRV